MDKTLKQIEARLLEQSYITRGLLLLQEQAKACGNLKACQLALIFLERAAKRKLELNKLKKGT